MPSIKNTTTSKLTSIPDSEKIHRKIEEATAGLANSWTKSLLFVPEEIASMIADYIKVMKSEVNLSDSYRKSVIEVLTKLSKSCNHKGFKNITRNDILSFLDSFRKPEEADPLHTWIGTYNLYRIHIQRFFKWL
ncbi:MAG TPA: hypothetical protein VE573_19750, partial [Nitrososphaeraceae archaeon]|nr:hypothetical protein [Nitrososphaeraceae archaeon]